MSTAGRGHRSVQTGNSFQYCPHIDLKIFPDLNFVSGVADRRLGTGYPAAGLSPRGDATAARNPMRQLSVGSGRSATQCSGRTETGRSAGLMPLPRRCIAWGKIGATSVVTKQRWRPATPLSRPSGHGGIRAETNFLQSYRPGECAIPPRATGDPAGGCSVLTGLQPLADG